MLQCPRMGAEMIISDLATAFVLAGGIVACVLFGIWYNRPEK